MQNDDHKSDGNTRRRARTRAALIEAGRQFLAEGNPNPSIQAITERAGVGFGSFFNHFSSKNELFEAALEETFRLADGLLADHLANIDNPLEKMVVQMRIFLRLPEIDPEAARVIAYSPADTFGIDSGYNLSFESNVLNAKESSLLPRPKDSNIAQTFIWGAFKHLLLLRTTGNNHPVKWADEFVEIALMTWGLDKAEAERLAHGPLPELG